MPSVCKNTPGRGWRKFHNKIMAKQLFTYTKRKPTNKAGRYALTLARLGMGLCVAVIMLAMLFFPQNYSMQHAWATFWQEHSPQAHLLQLVGQVTQQLREFELDKAYRTQGLAQTKAQTVATLLHTQMAEQPVNEQTMTQTNGPLRVSTANTRYFADATGKLVYLTGSHTWSNFQDNGGADPPPLFDYASYLDFLVAREHNFFRLWTWEESRWTTETGDDDYWFNPAPPYQRTGPGLALDGKAKFDLTQLEQSYFDRMRARISQAQTRGIYVSIMLFNGWSVSANKGGFGSNNPWQGHPFNRNNNINQIDGDPNQDQSGEEVHTLALPAITAFQKAYIRKVIDTVNDLDNVLFEISNESDGDSEAWQYEMITFIRDYEATKPQQHLIGMTVEWPGGDNTDLEESPADWISPNGNVFEPDIADGGKVILLDTDHLCGICGDRQWVWKAFTRGHNPIFMDGYDGAGYGVGGAGFDFADPTWVSLRNNLGYTHRLANRVNLAGMTPQPALASTGYCLAKATSPEAEYVVYLPDGGTTTVDLTGVSGSLRVEWLNPETGAIMIMSTVVGGAQRTLTAPFSGDAVLYLSQKANATPTPTTMPEATATRTLIPTTTPTPTATLSATVSPTLAAQQQRLYLPATYSR